MKLLTLASTVAVNLLLLASAQAQTTSSHATTTLTRTIIAGTSTTTVSPTPSADSSWTNDSQFIQDCLNSTNTFRAQHNATAVSWNTTLASRAQKITSKCKVGKIGEDKYRRYGSGENIAIGATTVADTIDGWGNQRIYFNFGNAKFTFLSRDFTQLVWKNSTQMGCGRTFCPALADLEVEGSVSIGGGSIALHLDSRSGFILACDFSAPGNVAGQFNNNVQSQISNGNIDQGMIGGGGQNADQGFIAGAAASTFPKVLLYVTMLGWALQI